ncbi:hypothetical protein NPIL_40061 [Nephila pilipes]|uniref:Uncharacterized protein n=1 Tax=Nephila pilipes TaxID=299642 RepID=A0A8X6PZ60_NEPPI|nr:hypothetical protein NPIL_40061 [Nephila pilipes]
MFALVEFSHLNLGLCLPMQTVRKACEVSNIASFIINRSRRIHPLTKPGRTLLLKAALTKHSGAFYSEIKVFFVSHGTVIKRLERVPLNGSRGME